MERCEGCPINDRECQGQRHRGLCVGLSLPATLAAGANPPPTVRIGRHGPCAWFGAPVLESNGKQVTRLCGPCGGKVRAKVFDCKHELHADTTIKECERCEDYSNGTNQPNGQ